VFRFINLEIVISLRKIIENETRERGGRETERKNAHRVREKNRERERHTPRDTQREGGIQ